MFVFKAAVVGAGTMGGEIAQVIASAGIPVVLKDVKQEFVDQGLEKARQVTQSQLGSLVGKQKITQEDADRQLEEITGRIAGTVDYDGFGDADFVIEAVPERMDVKQAVFAELDAVTPGHAILASNTSALSITQIAQATTRPDKVVGFHFFIPASVMRLIEVIEGEETSEETAAAAATFAQAIRKSAIRCGEVPGFVVNRILISSASEVWRGNEGGGLEPPEGDKAFQEAGGGAMGPLFLAGWSCLVLEEGVASAKDIEMGMMMGAGILPGPFTRADEAGLDTVLEQLERAQREWGDAFEPPVLLRRLVAQGRLGKKSGQGFFPYPQPDAGDQRETVLLETRGEVAIAWLHRTPPNPPPPPAVRDLISVWEEVQGKARALVIASSNIFTFSAGADIKEFTKMSPDAEGAELVRSAHRFMRGMESSSTVTIAAVNSIAFGGGCELAMACDFRIAAESASFGQPEINLGIIPGFGGTQRLPRLVGEGKALEMNLSGDAIGAYEALRFGLANQVVPDHELFDTAVAWARKLGEKAPIAIEQIKSVSAMGELGEGLEAEAQGFGKAFGSEDAKEGISAFLGKRQPKFQGR